MYWKDNIYEPPNLNSTKVIGTIINSNIFKKDIPKKVTLVWKKGKKGGEKNLEFTAPYVWPFFSS